MDVERLEAGLDFLVKGTSFIDPILCQIRAKVLRLFGNIVQK